MTLYLVLSSYNLIMKEDKQKGNLIYLQYANQLFYLVKVYIQSILLHNLCQTLEKLLSVIKKV